MTGVETRVSFQKLSSRDVLVYTKKIVGFCHKKYILWILDTTFYFFPAETFHSFLVTGFTQELLAGVTDVLASVSGTLDDNCAEKIHQV